MYSRSYEKDLPTIPESYGGVAFREPDPIPDDAPKSIPKSADVRFTTSPAPPDPNLTATTGADIEENTESVSAVSGFFDKLQLGRMFSGISGFDFTKLSIPKIGTEEILIVGLALFLFFSREGDKECAVLLALLLLIR